MRQRKLRAGQLPALLGVVLTSTAGANAQNEASAIGPGASGRSSNVRPSAEASGPGGRAWRGTPLSTILSLGVGRGLRFNNPYRLATPLGDTAESVSLTATYLDFGAAVLFGPREFRHGASLTGGVALQGIGQFVLTPSYLALLGLSDGLGLRGRLGVPVVVAPDTTLGLEAALGPTLDVAYGLGAMLELVGSVYFGAATDQTSITTIPMLSLQVGLFFDHRMSP
jgi:hypothetical protein